jgi:hypothetical protein
LLTNQKYDSNQAYPASSFADRQIAFSVLRSFGIVQTLIQ